MGTQIRVLGLNPTGKVPGFLMAVNVGVGRVDVGSIPRYLLLVGTKLAGGSVSPDTVISDVYPSSDIDSMFGARSEMCQMVRAAQKVIGVRIKAAATLENSSATAATATFTITTNASSAGVLTFLFGGETITVAIPNSSTPTQQEDLVVAAFAAKPNIPCVASNPSGTVTLTAATKGARGNDLIIYFDTAGNPTGSSYALSTTSAVAVTAPGGTLSGVRFGGGLPSDDVTNVLATLAGNAYFTTAFAHGAQAADAANVTKIKAYNDAKAALGSQLYEHITFGTNLPAAATNTFGAGTNRQRMSTAGFRGSPSSPPQIAAAYGAIRTQFEQLNPNSNFNNVAIPGLLPQLAAADRLSGGETGEQQTALESGVTPLVTQSDGTVTIVRAITGLNTKNGQFFYNCLDVGDARSPDVASELLQLAWFTEFAVNNPYVAPDPVDGEPDWPSGVATPKIWNSYGKGLLVQKIAQSWFESVTVSSEFDPVNKQIVTSINVEVMPKNHRLAGNLNQVVS